MCISRVAQAAHCACCSSMTSLQFCASSKLKHKALHSRSTAIGLSHKPRGELLSCRACVNSLSAPYDRSAAPTGPFSLPRTRTPPAGACASGQTVVVTSAEATATNPTICQQVNPLDTTGASCTVARVSGVLACPQIAQPPAATLDWFSVLSASKPNFAPPLSLVKHQLPYSCCYAPAKLLASQFPLCVRCRQRMPANHPLL